MFLDSSFQRLLSHVAFVKIHEAVALVWLSACESLRNETGHRRGVCFPFQSITAGALLCLLLRRSDLLCIT